MQKRKFSGSAPGAYKRPRSVTKKTRAPARRVAPFRRPMKQGEKKGMDTPLGLSPVIATTSTNGSIQVMNLIQMGTGSWNRVGRKAYLQSLRIKATASCSQAPETTTNNWFDNQLRMIVVWDRQPSGGAIPSFDTMFGTTVQDGTEASNIKSAVKFDNMDRFKVLKECVFSANVDAVTAIAGGSANTIVKQVNIDEYIKLGGKECVFSGQSNPMTIADISTGALYIVWRATVNTTPSNWGIESASSFARLRYTD